ncbi:MAG: LicD family protein [Muribaculaceae bacterium]|nr:LicD family protein [Muribaculaceae bacterium]
MDANRELSLEETQDILFEMMKDVDSFCRKNGIRYSLSDGTMLGAVRHGGFIPWDDDADLCMLREDFDRFAATYKSDRFHLLLNTHNKDEVFFYGFIKINDPSTYGAPTHHNIARHGVSLDIFPLESVPEDKNERSVYSHKIVSISNRIYHRHRKDPISIIKAYRHSVDGWWKRLDKAVHEPKYKDRPLTSQILGRPTVEVLVPKNWFDNLVDIDFNGHKFLGFKDTDSYLKMLFGPDYMTPREWSHHYSIMKKE